MSDGGLLRSVRSVLAQAFPVRNGIAIEAITRIDIRKNAITARR